MARAVLQIIGDASSVEAAFGSARRASRAASAAIAADSQRTMRAQERAASQAARAEERAAQQATRAQLQAYRQAASAAQLSARAREAAEHHATEIASREARARGLSMQAEAELRRRALNDLTSQYVAAERRMTATARRESAERVKVAREGERRYRSALGVGLGGARSFASGALSTGREIQGEMQSARARRATTEHTLNSALYQAGIGGDAASSMRSQVLRFATQRGMDPQALAEGIAAAQTQFSVLAQPGVSPQDALQQQLDLASFAQSTYQDPGEVMRVAGMLGQQGIRGADMRSILMQMTGMAQAGSIELSNMTREAMGPLMQNIARSTNASMTPQQRAEAVRSATLETMAVGEVTARSGGRSRDMLNALAKTRGSITNERTQESLYARLHAGGQQERALAASMFEQRNGHARLRQGTTAVGFLSQIVAGLGGDVNRATNLLGAGGPGRPMVLDAQQRRLMLLLASQGTNGRTVAQSVADMQAQGATFDEQRVAQGQALVQSEQSTQLQRDENARMQALTGNTRELQNLSNRIASVQASNPITSAIAGAAGLGAVGAAARSPVGLAGTLLAGGTLANLGAIATGRDASGRRLGLPERIGRGLLSGAAAIPVPGVGLLAGAAQASLGLSDVGRGAAGGGSAAMLTNALERLTNALQGGQIRATVDPHDAAHAAAEASTTPARR